jgi:hypothetical protein
MVDEQIQPKVTFTPKVDAQIERFRPAHYSFAPRATRILPSVSHCPKDDNAERLVYAGWVFFFSSLIQ